MSEEDTTKTQQQETVNKAEELKKLGNDAFLARNYEEASKYYSEAIAIEPTNAIFYSNRSACYAFLKQWQKAFDDGLQSISKDPKFLKGYYRLATAQAELKQFDDAETTLRAALALEPENEVTIRQLNSLKTKRVSASKQAQVEKKVRKLDEAQMKEFMELQDQLEVYNKDLRSVKAKISVHQRDSRVNAVTSNQIQTLPGDVPLYRSIGKAFVFAERSDIESHLEKEIGEINKSLRDLTDRQEYLERRVASTTSNIQELIKA